MFAFIALQLQITVNSDNILLVIATLAMYL